MCFTLPKFGVTPLHNAASAGRPGVVRALLDHGADPLAKCGILQTALSRAKESFLERDGDTEGTAECMALLEAHFPTPAV